MFHELSKIFSRNLCIAEIALPLKNGVCSKVLKIFDGLVSKRSNFSALAMELCLFCIKPSILFHFSCLICGYCSCWRLSVQKSGGCKYRDLLLHYQHRGLNRMAEILLMTFSSAFSWIKLRIQKIIHWNILGGPIDNTFADNFFKCIL